VVNNMMTKKPQCPQVRIMELEEDLEQMTNFAKMAELRADQHSSENVMLRKMMGRSVDWVELDGVRTFTSYDEKLRDLGKSMVKIYSNAESSFANQGQGMDGFSMLANYTDIAEKFKAALEDAKDD